MTYVGGRLLNIKETAELLGEKERTVRESWRAWGLTGYQVGKRWKFREHELQRWIEGRKEIGNGVPRYNGRNGDAR